MADPQLKNKILEFLENQFPRDFNIQEIADKLHIHRNTISTYLRVLEAEKKVLISRSIGKMNMYIFHEEKN